MKPLINLDELQLQPRESGTFVALSAAIGTRIGARKLGYRLMVVPPGKTAVPFHNHRINEEMFFVLEGEGRLRFGSEEFPFRKGDVIACPPGGREVAHQMLNTGTSELRYLALSTNEPNEVCEYPDSNKVGIFVGTDPYNPELRKLFRAETDVPYLDRE